MKHDFPCMKLSEKLAPLVLLGVAGPPMLRGMAGTWNLIGTCPTEMMAGKGTSQLETSTVSLEVQGHLNNSPQFWMIRIKLYIEPCVTSI